MLARQHCFLYAFLIAAFKPLKDNATKRKLDDWADNGREGSDIPKVDFSCLKGKYPVKLKGINIFGRANIDLDWLTFSTVQCNFTFIVFLFKVNDTICINIVKFTCFNLPIWSDITFSVSKWWITFCNS
jgi:hypothetical protein